MDYTVTFEKRIFKDPDNGYCVCQFRTADKSVPDMARISGSYSDRLVRFTATGYGLPETESIEFVLSGEWMRDKRHGCQFAVKEWREIIPKTAEGIQAYLSCGLIKGIGEKLAEAIVARFGSNTLDILEHQPERLLEIRGITEGRLADIRESYAESHSLRDLMTFLAPYGITPRTALKIQQEFGGGCLEILRNQPFMLCRISGFGFKRVDNIALKTACRPNDPMRVRGALYYILDENSSQNGHLYLETDVLCREALQLLNEKLPLPEQRLQMREVTDELYNAVLRGELISGNGAVYLPRHFFHEDEVARRISEILAEPVPLSDISAELAQVVKELGISLSKKQADAVKMAFRYNLSIITGSPGTGKTTVLKTVIELFRRIKKGGKILLSAPTGRASRRMAESTGCSEAKTLHSALGLTAGDEADSAREDKKSLDADLLIIDETSMVDMWLSSRLFPRIRPGTKVLLVGDADQLPSVGAGNVFRELISCEMIPVTVLDEIFRQSKDSLIAYNAKFINHNETQLYYGDEFQLQESHNQKEAAKRIREIYMKEAAESGVENVQILSPFRKEGEASAEKLNQAIRELVNPPAPGMDEFTVGSRTFRPGDRVMQMKNNYHLTWTMPDGSKGTGAFNGDIGTVVDITPDGSEMVVDMEGRLFAYQPVTATELEHAYAMTVHKAMGSEFDTVIVPILSAHMVLLHRNLLYTAISRAKRRVILVGQKKYLHIAIHTNKIAKRNTLLGQRILHYCQLQMAVKETQAVFSLPEGLKSTG